MPSSPRRRLDVWLALCGLAESREKAQALIMAGRVTVDGRPALKAGARVSSDAQIAVLPGPQHVGRGGLKLEGALDSFGVDPAGRVAVDVGASTGGFTEVLLDRGATRIYAVDVGHNQLHERLRGDPRVVVREGVNARSLSQEHVSEACGIAVMDVSFISVLKILPALRPLLTPDADVVTLVKPQFELRRRDVGRGGIVRDPDLHRQALRGVASIAQSQIGFVMVAACASPITGADGNREFFLHLRTSAEPLPPDAWDAVLAAALE
jgi:23S rRNA (cytidine1920-2'-O)/16S rRNA (cytidine1409-2'-O)-methyltransferase